MTTEITRIETAKNLAEDDFELLSPLDNDRFRERVEELMNVTVPPPDMRALYSKAYERHMEIVEDMTSNHPWECLNIYDTDLSLIFSQYGEKVGLFSDRTKKHQFVDAIVFEQLKRIATTDTPVYIFSKDKDFVDATHTTPNIGHARSWEDLLQLLGMDKDVNEVKGFIESYGAIIVENVSESIDSRFRSRLPPSTLNSLNYVTNIEITSSKSFRHGNHIVVSGTVLITYWFPYRLPVPFGVAREQAEILETLHGANKSEGGEYCFEVSLLANLYDFRDKGMDQDQLESTLSGKMTFEIKGSGHFVGYRIIRADWPVS